MTLTVFLVLTFAVPAAVWVVAAVAGLVIERSVGGWWGLPDLFVFTPGGAAVVVLGGILASLAIQFVWLTT